MRSVDQNCGAAYSKQVNQVTPAQWHKRLQSPVSVIQGRLYRSWKKSLVFFSFPFANKINRRSVVQLFRSQHLHLSPRTDVWWRSLTLNTGTVFQAIVFVCDTKIIPQYYDSTSASSVHLQVSSSDSAAHDLDKHHFPINTNFDINHDGSITPNKPLWLKGGRPVRAPLLRERSLELS